jgi:3'(2'), 5'-bisphosphate nucleotidase
MIKKNELKSTCENLIDIFNIAGKVSIDLFAQGLEIKIKEDKSPVSNGDLKVNELISNRIKKLTPEIPIISEETVDINIKNTAKIFWLIDPIDGTKEYISGKDEYTLNAALVINTVPVLGLVGVPKKNRLFYTYGPGESYLIQEGKTKKIECKKQQPKGKVVALSSVLKPSDVILNKLKEFNVSSIVKMASSYKFCVIATGEYDIYAAKERANEWDYAAGHAIAQNAGAIIKTLDEKPFLYGKEDYKNPSLLIKRSENLND